MKRFDGSYHQNLEAKKELEGWPRPNLFNTYLVLTYSSNPAQSIVQLPCKSMIIKGLKNLNHG